QLAVEQPFPDVRGSEDAHTWYRMSAAGTGFAFAPAIATLYRVPQGTRSSADRARIGAEKYYRVLVEMNEDGFSRALEIAISRGRVEPHQVARLWEMFLRRVAVTVAGEGHQELAD